MTQPSRVPTRACRALSAALTAGLAAVSLAAAPAVAAPRAPAPTPAALSAAISIAGQSVDQVVELHDLSVSVGHLKGVPKGAIRGPATQLGHSLSAEAAAARGIKAPANSPTAVLAASLASYSGLAAGVAAAATKPYMPAAFAPALARTDRSWQGTLKALDKEGHANLLKKLPPLQYPAGPGPRAKH